jgi:fumarate hydratase class II
MAERDEKDALGTVQVPADAYWGAQTQRALNHFAVSGQKMPPTLIGCIALIKRCAAQANQDLGLLDSRLAEAIIQAAGDVMDGQLNDQFPLDVLQTGSGTSTHMNVNEVIAGRANERLTGNRGGKAPVHPNDHVNLGQSSNDVFPSAIHMAVFQAMVRDLDPAVARLAEALEAKAEVFADVVKIGRTHLQDAVPLTLGQVFSGYAAQMWLGLQRLQALHPRLAPLALGGTAVGTGLNTHPRFAGRVIAMLAQQIGLPFVETTNHFQAQAAQDTMVEVSGALKTIAVSLSKVANDLRWLASGPRCGIGEIRLPALQPGSSIMPGKVNPVACEVAIQAAAQVIGNDAAVTLGGLGGQFELNTMLPLIARNLIENITLLTGASRMLADKCVCGIEADRRMCAAHLEKSLALVTALVPYIGYDKAASLAQKAYAENKTIRQVATEENIIPMDVWDRILTINPIKV